MFKRYLVPVFKGCNLTFFKLSTLHINYYTMYALV